MQRSTKWFLGILAIFLLIVGGFFLLIIGLLTSSIPSEIEVVTQGSGDKVGVVEVFGTIVSSSEINRQLKGYAEDNSIRAILLHINSPGGGVVASQEIYEQVRRIREEGTPVIVSMGSLAASGGYYIACGATRIVANKGTLTGSIGVIAEFLQLREALDKIGVGVKVIKSGRMKDAGSPMKDMTTEDEAYFQSLMDDVHRQFAEVVILERKLDRDKVLEIADGRVFTGEDALVKGLIDTLGTFQDAVAITAAIAGIDGEPALVRERQRHYWWEDFGADVMSEVTALKNEILDRPVLSYRFVGP